jgi:hypothetical protein
MFKIDNNSFDIENENNTPMDENIDYLPWETQRLTPFAFFKSIFYLLAESRNAISSIKHTAIYRAYLFSIIVFTIHIFIAYVIKYSNGVHSDFWGSTEALLGLFRSILYLLIVPLGWMTKETIVMFLVFYLVAKKKVSLLLTAKISCYASIFILIYWIPIISDMNIFIKGILIGCAVGARHEVDLSRTLLASICATVVLYLLSYFIGTNG